MMKKVITILLVTTCIVACKKDDQTYEDDQKNRITTETLKSNPRFRMQGTYKMGCLFGTGWANYSYYEYEVEVMATPFLNYYTISPLKLDQNYTTKNIVSFVMDTTSSSYSFNIPETKFNSTSMKEETLRGAGSFDSINNSITFIAYGDGKHCDCTGTKR
jgi:hypothetical protein